MRAPLLLALALLAGCVAPGAELTPASVEAAPSDLAGLAHTAKEAVVGADGTVTLTFEGAAPVSAGMFVVGNRQAETIPVGTFDVDERVGWAEISLVDDADQETADLYAVILDGEGRILCAAAVETACTAPVAGADTYAATALAAVGVAPPGTVVTLEVVLHPVEHLVLGDATAGVDGSIAFRLSLTGVNGGEDNIGVLGDGTVFVQNGVHTFRSRDDGATWEEVGPPATSQRTLDPMLYVDAHRGIVYVDQLYVGCSVLAWSKDAGETWMTNPAACGVPSNDHQKIGSGPGTLPGMASVYYSFSHIGLGNIWASRSVDGGLTFTPHMVTVPGDGWGPWSSGHVFADELGNVYVPMYDCGGDGSMIVGVSHDRGLTYRVVQASAQPGPCYDPDPGLWTDTDGNVYLAYHRPDGVYYVSSTDHGDSWSEPVLLSPPTLRSFVHVDAVAGDPGRLAVVYRATPDTDKGPDLADGWAAWRMYVTFVENATSATPTIRTSLVAAPDDIAQRGPICTNGIGCFGGSRNLVDFIDIGVGPDGRVYVSYSDGCEGTAADCPLPADSRGRIGVVGILEEGPRLFADRAPWAR